MKEYQTEDKVGNYIDSLLNHVDDATLTVEKKDGIKSVSITKRSEKRKEEQCALCDKFYPKGEMEEIENEYVCPFCEPKVKHILGLE